MDTLDITPMKEKGKALMEAIEQAVGDTQLWIVKPLPNVILMTLDQFDDLCKIANIPEMHESEDRIYITKHNVMEVRVKS